MLYFTIAALVVILDQASKRIVLNTLSRGEPREVIGSILRIKLSYNPGAILGFLSESRPVLLAMTFISIAALIFFSYRMRYAPVLKRVSLGLILGGAFGNLVDRVASGSVVDFIDMGIGSYRWPTYNVADIAVTVGAVILIGGFIFHPEDESRESDYPGTSSRTGD
ncbi:MAG: signal peptidase II [Candidatus Latescibacteria bacterium]|nr:signal peptidase II [bacterium]MBD3424906.1 signal peptidase II [Candidatus Latescibacterota bacterium]